jgi:hypothetical protein
MEIISRQEAARKGYRKFYTGKECIHGHHSERYVTTGNCVACLRGTAPDSIRVSYMVHVRDRDNVDAYVSALAQARELARETPQGRDEEAYWKLVANYRKLGCPDRDLPRTLGTFTLPEGRDP